MLESADRAAKFQDSLRYLRVILAVLVALVLALMFADLTISLGIACVAPVVRRSPSGIVRLVDETLYASKDGGRNQARLLEEEYEHMKTGYCYRTMPGGGSGQPFAMARRRSSRAPPETAAFAWHRPMARSTASEVTCARRRPTNP